MAISRYSIHSDLPWPWSASTRIVSGGTICIKEGKKQRSETLTHIVDHKVSRLASD